jgi:hypothetical protein
MVKIMGNTITKEEIEKQREQLKNLVEQNGMRIHTVLRHISTSGMQREISPVIICRDGSIRHIAYALACIAGYAYTEKHGHAANVVKGCGMDTGFDLVYNVSGALYPNDERGAYKISQEWI